MAYLRSHKPYQSKPPPSARINWNHPLARGLRLFIPLTEGAGIPHAWINGARKYPDAVTKMDNYTWLHKPEGLVFRGDSQANSRLRWDNAGFGGWDDFEWIGVVTPVAAGGNYDFIAGTDTYAPGFPGHHGGNWKAWHGGAQDTGQSYDQDVLTVLGGRSYSSNSVWFGSEARGSDYSEVVTSQRNIAETATYTFNSGHDGDSYGAQDTVAHHWQAFWNRLLTDNERQMLLRDPGAIWQIYSEPMPIWISSGAAPPAWNNSINEISAPASVNEITNANIQSINEI